MAATGSRMLAASLSAPFTEPGTWPRNSSHLRPTISSSTGFSSVIFDQKAASLRSSDGHQIDTYFFLLSFAEIRKLT